MNRLSVLCSAFVLISAVGIASAGDRGNGCPGGCESPSPFGPPSIGSNYGCQAGTCRPHPTSRYWNRDQSMIRQDFSAPYYTSPIDRPPVYQAPVLNGRPSSRGMQDRLPSFTSPRQPVSSTPAANRFNGAPLSIPRGMEGISALPHTLQAGALKQQVCPVTSGKLGSMGKPILVDVAGRRVFVCCEGCVANLKKNPAKYLAVQSNPQSSWDYQNAEASKLWQ